MTSKYITTSPVADSIPYDDELCDFGKDTVQEALEQVCKLLKFSKPSYSWGRGGNVPNGTWLINNEVPSNRTGTPFNLDNGLLFNLWVGNQNITSFDVSLYEHDGNSVNLSLLTTVSVIAASSKFFTSADFGTVNITSGKQLAIRITSGSAKNPEVFAQISGD